MEIIKEDRQIWKKKKVASFRNEKNIVMGEKEL